MQVRIDQSISEDFRRASTDFMFSIDLSVFFCRQLYKFAIFNKKQCCVTETVWLISYAY